MTYQRIDFYCKSCSAFTHAAYVPTTAFDGRLERWDDDCWPCSVKQRISPMKPISRPASPVVSHAHRE